MEDYGGPEHTVPGQLDPAGRTGNTEIPGLSGAEERWPEPDGPQAPVEFRLVVPVLAHAHHHNR